MEAGMAERHTVDDYSVLAVVFRPMNALWLRVSFFAVMIVCLIAPVSADEKPTSLLDAQAAIESNLRTSGGKAYDERLGKESMEKREASGYDAAMQAECRKRRRKLLDSSETRQRRRGEGSPTAPHNQDGDLRTGNPAQEHFLTAAERSILGRRLHEINSLKRLVLPNFGSLSLHSIGQRDRKTRRRHPREGRLSRFVYVSEKSG
jgi:hypothetical protein